MAHFDNALRREGDLRPPDRKHDAEIARRGREDFDFRAAVLSDHFKTHDFMLGDNFSGADICVGHSCFMAKHTGLIGDHPALENYYGRLAQRPAFQSVYGEFA